MGLLKEAAKLLLKNKKNTVGVIKEVKGGVSAVTGVAPTVSKELSMKTRAKKLLGFYSKLGTKK